jgi:hypothetical protein
MKFVIARHIEDITWADNYNRTVVQKGKDMPNIGREASSYLLFIVKNYCDLNGEYLFCQGNPFDHCVDFPGGQNYYGEWRESGSHGEPWHNSELALSRLCESLGVEDGEPYRFKPGAQFRVTSDEILRRDYTWYVKALYLSMEKNAPWEFERLWPRIFKSLKE